MARFEYIDCFSNDFHCRIAGQFRESRVDNQDAGIRIGDYHAFSCRLEHGGGLTQIVIVGSIFVDIVDHATKDRLIIEIVCPVDVQPNPEVKPAHLEQP